MPTSGVTAHNVRLLSTITINTPVTVNSLSLGDTVLAGLISGSGGPFVLRYREIGDCVDIVRDLLEGSTDRERAPWTSTPGASLSPDSRVSHGSGPRETRESGGIGTGARVEVKGSVRVDVDVDPVSFL